MENITNDKQLTETGKEKDALDFILSNAFKSGFGTLNKTELDLILFTAILKYSDEDNLSDHKLSKYLQITQQRIRNLREKASVKYMILGRKKAINKFIDKCEHARVTDSYVDIPVNDIAIKNEIEGLLDEKNILMHHQLNPKIFRLRIDDYLDFLILLELYEHPAKNKKDIEGEILKKVKAKAKKDADLKKAIGDEDDSLRDMTVSTLKKALIEGGFSYGIEILASLVPGGSLFSGAAKSLLEKISSKV